MGKSREAVKEQCQKVKKMYDSGFTIKEIAVSLGISKESVYNSFTIMGISLKKPVIDESKLVYADNSVELEKVVINGKGYIDITPVFAPR